MILKEITDYLESYAPLSLQENYDNSGLICGNHQMIVSSALICIDSTEAVIDEAIANGCNLVIAHHPIIFSGLKKINGTNYIERVIIKAIQHNIAIYAAHTNLDNAENGVNYLIARRLNLINLSVLVPQKNILKKLITYCPQEKAENIREALFAVGAGKIGNYDECSFTSMGEGTFKASVEARPYVGELNKQHKEKEAKIELIFPNYIESKIISTLLTVHPYEEVAYDILSLENTLNKTGSGIIGELKEEMDEMLFLIQLKKIMNTSCIRYTALLNKAVKKIAICGGSGSFLLNKTINQNADVFITSDFKYHQFFDAENKIVIADIGHYESEQFTIELFYDILTKKFNTFALHLSKTNTNPINYL